MKKIALVRPPVVEDYVMPNGKNIRVVRDDLLEGGTKMRGLKALFSAAPYVEEWVYGSPTYGYAQVALAIGGYTYGKRVTIFVPKRPKSGLSEYSLKAQSYGAKIVQLPMGFQSHCNAAAKQYAAEGTFGLKQPDVPLRGLVPFGVRHDAMIESIANAARLIEPRPKEVWTILSSGTLSAGLQRAWPKARVFGVCIGHAPTEVERGRAKLFRALEKFEKPAKEAPPFPSCPNYDAKAWKFLMQHASNNALFWNVAA